MTEATHATHAMREIERMIAEQRAAKLALDANVVDRRARELQLWHDDALAEECLIRLERGAYDS